VLARARRIDNRVELGTNAGNNLQALRQLLPGCKLFGVRTNANTCARARFAVRFPRDRQYDLTLSKGG
jgi:spore coat polysaccharide biosynthesis protein SpsF